MSAEGFTNGTGAQLTGAMLRAAMQKIENAPRKICGVTEPHVVHPKAEGWTRCANCFQPVLVPGHTSHIEGEPT